MRPERAAATPREIAPGAHCLTIRGANVYFLQSGPSWVLVDTGWPHSGRAIRGAVERLFGPGTRPAAILLTHAHPDHLGSAAELSEFWDLPISAHPADLPLIRGGILPPVLLDPVGRFIAAVTPVLPGRSLERMTSSTLEHTPCTLLGPGASIPGLPDWECVATPGHSPGHVVFFRRSDRVLVAGDAVLTVPLWGVLPTIQKISLPPWISSWNWPRTKRAIAKIAALEPRVLATDHGIPMTGAETARDLRAFSRLF